MTDLLKTKLSRRRVLQVAAVGAAGIDPALRALAYAQGSDKPEKEEVKIGFIPLTDCASVVMASVLGIDKKYGVTMERTYNGNALGNMSPHYTWTFDADKVAITGPELMQKLGETKPVAIGSPPGLGMGAGGVSGRPDPNWTGPNDSAGGGGGGRGARGGAAGGGRGGRGAGAPNSFGFSTWLLKDGEDKYIANRLVEIFSEAAAAGSATTSGKTPAAKKSS